MGIAALDAFHLLHFLHNQVVEFTLTADFDIGDDGAAASWASRCATFLPLRPNGRSVGWSAHVPRQHFCDLLFGDGADDLLGHLAALEDKQRGDAADVEPAGGVDVFVHVQLDDF
jgi:hypothetical protein